MSDLTDEEIIATRKLNGVDDDLYKEKKEEISNLIKNLIEDTRKRGADGR